MIHPKHIPRSLWALPIALCCFQPLQAAEILTPNISEIMANHSPSRQHTAEELERFYLEPIPSPLEFMAAGCGQVRKKTWKANLPSMSQIRVL